MRRAMRSRRSTAAFRLNVSTRIRSGSPPRAIRAATDSTRVVALPVPGPARTSRGPPRVNHGALRRVQTRGVHDGRRGTDQSVSATALPHREGAAGAWWRKRGSRDRPVLVVVLAGRRSRARGGGRGVRGTRVADATPPLRTEAELPGLPSRRLRHARPTPHERTACRGRPPCRPKGPQVCRGGIRWRKLSGVTPPRPRHRPTGPVACRAAADGPRWSCPPASAGCPPRGSGASARSSCPGSSTPSARTTRHHGTAPP